MDAPDQVLSSRTLPLHCRGRPHMDISNEELRCCCGDAAAVAGGGSAADFGRDRERQFRLWRGGMAWRRQAGLSGKRGDAKKPSASFVPVALPAPVAAPTTMAEHSSARTPERGLIEIELAGGRRVRVSGMVDANALKQVIAALEGR